MMGLMGEMGPIRQMGDQPSGCTASNLLQLTLLNLRYSHEVALQAGTKRLVSVDWNRDALAATRRGKNVMTPFNPSQNPPLALKDSGKLLAGNRFHIATSSTVAD